MPISRIERQALLDQANSLYTQADAQRTNALALVSKIVAIVPDDVSHWWDAWPAGALNPPRQIAALPAAILMRDAAGVPLVPNIRRGNAMQVFERQGNLLRVLPTPINGQLWWVRAEDLPVPAPAG